VSRLLLLIVAAGVLTYVNGLGHPFLFDDRATVVENASIRELGQAFAPPRNTPVAGRPLVNLSFALNYLAGGLDPFGYRAVNLAIHVACALLVFGIVRRTLVRLSGALRAAAVPADLALMTAALFVVHPLTSEVVNYVTQRTEGVMALCYLATVYAAIRSHERAASGRWQGLAIAACIAGAWCKETIATAPLAVILWDRAFVYPSFAAARRERWRLYAGLALTWIVLGATLAIGGQSLAGGFSTARVSWWTYFLNQPRLIARYLWLAVWPGPLVLYYGWPAAVSIANAWPWLLLIAALFIGSVALFARRPAMGYPVAWFFLTLGPTSSVVTIATEVGAERRMYLALPGLIALVVSVGAVAAARRGLPRRVVASVAVLLIVLLAARTVARNTEYASPLRMAETILARWPTANAEYLVGTELLAAGRTADAIPHLRSATMAYPPARYALGTALLARGETEAGIRALQQFVLDEPQSLASRDAHAQLANAFAATGRFVEAIPHYREYLAANSGDASAWTGLAIAQIQIGASREAVDAFRRAAAADPSQPRYRLNLARALLDAGQLEEAQRLASALPSDPAAHDILGRIHLRRGDVAAARAAFERAVQIDPGYAPARDALRALGPR
jgi:protein O-mannosyl-transferase